jgi:thioredoxin-related protein
MKKAIFLALTLSGIALALAAFRNQNTTEISAAAAPELKWYTWEEAVELNKTTPKKIMVDVYTHWCGWCKVMDKQTFTDSTVATYMTANFYPVKLNAEQKEDIKFNSQNFKYIEGNNGGKGVHALAYALLDGQLGYPTIVYLNEKYERIMISPGFKKPDAMMKELTFAAEEHYTKKSWEKYQEEGK